MRRKLLTMFMGVCMLATTVRAAIKTETITYRQGDTTLIGVISYDDSTQESPPAC